MRVGFPVWLAVLVSATLACSGDETSTTPGGQTPGTGTNTPAGGQDTTKGVPKDTSGATDEDTTPPPDTIDCTPGANGTFYALKVKQAFGKGELPFCAFENKVVLLVNGASECGFTPQYGPLQDMYEKYRDDQKLPFEILAFPSNSFNQETGGEKEITDSCVNEYKLTFPFAEIAPVIEDKAKSLVPQPVYQWIYTQPGFSQPVNWNFNKFLVSKQGKVVARFKGEDGVAPGGALDQAIAAELAK